MATSVSALAKSRAIILHKTPYLANLLYHLVPKEAPGLGTMGVTDKHVLLYDSAFVNSITQEELSGVLIHECLHVLSGHLPRINALDDKNRANVAADLAIYDTIIAMGYVLPAVGVKPADYKFPPGLILEDYYKRLKGKTLPKPQVCAGMCGSGVGHGSDKDDGADGRELMDKELAVRATVQAMKSHAEKGGQLPGILPGLMKELLDAINAPAVVPWKSVLRARLSDTVGDLRRGSSDYSMRNLSKRTFIRGRPIPGMVDYPPTIGIIVDTSGSMHHALLDECFRETAGILSGLSLSWAWLLQADVQVACPPKKVRMAHLKKGIEVHGRGGTDFTFALQAVQALKPRPSLVVYFTDGYGSTSFRPQMHVVWCLVGGNKNPPAPWGSVVVVDK